jgi:hypothetical protein
MEVVAQEHQEFGGSKSFIVSSVKEFNNYSYYKWHLKLQWPC